MVKNKRKESFQNEIGIEVDKLLERIITELRENSRESEKIVEQMIRDTLDEELFLER